MTDKAGSTANIRRYTRRALTGYIILVIGGLFLFGQFESQNTKIAQISANQLSNRVANVSVWCGAINEGRNEDRARAAKSPPGTPPYKLKNLNCAQLEKETAQSGTKPSKSTKPKSGK